MHIPRLFLTTDAIRIEGRSPSTPLDLSVRDAFDIISPPVINQITKVLRLRQNDRVVVLDNTGRVLECNIDRIEREAVGCVVQNVHIEGADSSVSVTVALAILKGERFDWSLQKLTELGATTVVPLLTDRTVVKLDEGTTGDAKGTQTKIARWQAILREAAEQSERATIPHLVPPKKFENFISSLTGSGIQPHAFICAERLSTTPLKHILLDYARNPEPGSATADKTMTLIVGPEGGFTEREILIAQDAGIMPVSLGKRILRSETAAIYALAQVISTLEK